MKEIKKIGLAVFMIMNISFVKAQMTSAKKVNWDVTVKSDFNISQNKVWNMLNDNEALVKISNGYVKSVKNISTDLIETRSVFFSSGTKRKESIIQKEEVYKFLVINIQQESLPKGIKKVEIGVFTKMIDELNCNVIWRAKIEGNGSQKDKVINQLTQEFESYVKGIKKIN